MTLGGKVSEILKKHYPDSPETKGLKLGPNASRISFLIGDPLLWLRVAYGETAVDRFAPLNVIAHLKLGTSLSESKVKEITERRLEVLDAAIGGLVQRHGQDLSKIDGRIEAGERRNTLFATALDEGRVIRSRTFNESQAETESSGCSPRRRGVVADMYPGEQCEGYIVTLEGGDYKREVYRFDNAAIKAGCTFLSLGDIVTFSVSGQRIVNASLQVAEYFPGGLKEDFVKRFLQDLIASTPTYDPVESCDTEPENLVGQVLEASALWKSLLSEERLYHLFYKELLSVSLACGVTCESRSEEHADDFLSMFKGCSFIRHLPKMLQQDLRQTYDQGTDEFKSFQQDVQTASHLLKACLPCERAYTLAEALKCFTELLSKPELGMEEETKSLALCVLDENSNGNTDHLGPEQNEESSAAVNITAREEPLLEDPLFWLRLLHESRMIEHFLRTQPFSGCQLKTTEKIVEKRHQALRACKCDLGEICRQDLSAQVKQYEGQVFLTEAQLQSSPETDEEESCGPTQHGVVTDLYLATEGRLWEGYIVCPAQNAQAEDRVFHFDNTTAVNKKSAYDLGVHIGDVVAFKPGKANASQIANATLQVIKYFSGVLNEATLLPFLSQIKRAANNVEMLQIVLQYPAVWKYLLNEPSIYKKQYKVILSVYKTDDSPTTSLQKKLMGTFKGSSFIQELVALLDEDTKQESDEHYQNDVHGATFFLIAFVQCFPNSVQPVLQQLAELLSKLKMYKELKALVSAVIDSYLVPPDSEQVLDRPWRCIPTILTKQELEESVKMPAASSGLDPNLPVVKEYGCYESAEEYGQTYFSLLRMDCYAELIQTITHLKTQHTDECTFYYITFSGLAKGTGHRIVYNLHYETTLPLKRAGSGNESPLLRQGNLVCFSIGGKFENDLVWATVDRSEHKSSKPVDFSGKIVFCKQGRLQVELCSEANDWPDEKVMELFKRSENIVAVESPAYFRAYQPVLEALKTIDVSKIHFINDLLEPSNDVKSKPEIIDDSSVVDPQPLYKQPDIPNMSVRELKVALESEEEKHKFCLDRSQREAVYKALSHPLTVIQGPPGTGKTHVALRLLQLFLSLSTLPKQKPIILMAYKNCALDHILKECVKFCSPQSIVRIGHVSEGYEDLQELTLRRRASSIRASFIQQFDWLFKRVKMASQEVEKRSKLSWENCLPSMTPQWLTSLLMDAPKTLGLSEKLKQKFSNDPQKYLQLLRDNTIKGKRDETEKSEVRRALSEAWKLWTENLEKQLTTPRFSQPSTQHSMPQCSSDFEQDYETMEQERRMAADDLEEESESEVVTKGDIVLSTSVLDTMDLGTEKTVDNSQVWKLASEQRKQLIVNTLSKHYSEGVEYMKECLREYNKVREEYELGRQYRCLQILKRARVVGMTTTGAAIHQELLNKLEAPIMFVEEAAEVLESNLLATLTPHVKHLVLIGDHKQLKPQVACYKLAKEHKFNTSMFERLVKNNFPYTLLMRQSRMHPRFVDLYSYHYYEQRREAGKIMSSKRVENYQHPSCMASPIFWWSYSDKYEEKHGPSIINQHEAEMVAALCLWLLSQRTEDERTQRIQVLTPYRAQIDEIKTALKASANRMPSWHSIVPRKEIKVSTVDEFQGHESDVIILSMVRSNLNKQIGFLKEKNRLVVGTSRQKRGLYIVGNAEFLKKTSTVLWKPFIQKLENATGAAVPVKFEGKHYNCRSAAELMTAACNPESLRQDAKDRQQQDQVETDSPVKAPSSAATTPLSPVFPATQPLRQQSIPHIFRECVLELQSTAALNNWKNIARRLGVEDPEIDRIDAENKQKPAEAFYQTMLHWYNKGEEATSQQLIKALEKTQLRKVVDDFQANGYFDW